MAKKRDTSTTTTRQGTKADPHVFDACGRGGCDITRPGGKWNVAVHPDAFRFTYTNRNVKKDKKTGKITETPAVPCASKRTTCPVQLIYKDGQPMLRFCTKAGNRRPGHVIPVNDAMEAQRIAAAACQCWKQHGGDFSRCEAVTSHALGRVRR
jgi:hypothetical protein